MKMRNPALNLKQKPKNENNTYEKKNYYAFGLAIPDLGNSVGAGLLHGERDHRYGSEYIRLVQRMDCYLESCNTETVVYRW